MLIPSIAFAEDSDGDGFSDEDESYAGSLQNNSTSIPEHHAYGTCTDGIDNDLDLLVDMSDPGCGTNAAEDSECILNENNTCSYADDVPFGDIDEDNIVKMVDRHMDDEKFVTDPGENKFTDQTLDGKTSGEITNPTEGVELQPSIIAIIIAGISAIGVTG